MVRSSINKYLHIPIVTNLLMKRDGTNIGPPDIKTRLLTKAGAAETLCLFPYTYL